MKGKIEIPSSAASLTCLSKPSKSGLLTKRFSSWIVLQYIGSRTLRIPASRISS